MAQHYSDPRRASDAHSLPDVEVWQDEIVTVCCHRCGDFEIPASQFEATEAKYCPSCERELDMEDDEENPDGQDHYVYPDRKGWFYWYCLPGCLPEGDPIGPFASEAEALADARESGGTDEDDDDGEVCDECGCLAEGISRDHATSCSLHPDNVSD